MTDPQKLPAGDLTIEDARQKYACHYCEAEAADECICDDLNFADQYCDCGGAQ